MCYVDILISTFAILTILSTVVATLLTIALKKHNICILRVLTALAIVSTVVAFWKTVSLYSNGNRIQAEYYLDLLDQKDYCEKCVCRNLSDSTVNYQELLVDINANIQKEEATMSQGAWFEVHAILINKLEQQLNNLTLAIDALNDRIAEEAPMNDIDPNAVNELLDYSKKRFQDTFDNEDSEDFLRALNVMDAFFGGQPQGFLEEKN